jgi:hypothetical protein
VELDLSDAYSPVVLAELLQFGQQSLLLGPRECSLQDRGSRGVSEDGAFGPKMVESLLKVLHH